MPKKKPEAELDPLERAAAADQAEQDALEQLAAARTERAEAHAVLVDQSPQRELVDCNKEFAKTCQVGVASPEVRELMALAASGSLTPEAVDLALNGVKADVVAAEVAG